MASCMQVTQHIMAQLLLYVHAIYLVASCDTSKALLMLLPGKAEGGREGPGATNDCAQEAEG